MVASKYTNENFFLLSFIFRTDLICPVTLPSEWPLAFPLQGRLRSPYPDKCPALFRSCPFARARECQPDPGCSIVHHRCSQLRHYHIRGVTNSNSFLTCLPNQIMLQDCCSRSGPKVTPLALLIPSGELLGEVLKNCPSKPKHATDILF